MKIRVRTVVEAALLGSALALVQYLNFSGFCYSQVRFLPDSELLARAIQYDLKNPPIGEGQISYASIDEFLTRNPNCCLLHRHGGSLLDGILDGPWVRIFGWYIAVADVWYKFREDGPRNYYHSAIAVDSCGKVRERLGPLWDFGRPSPKSRDAFTPHSTRTP
jgi:hypothetical protein